LPRSDTLSSGHADPATRPAGIVAGQHDNSTRGHLLEWLKRAKIERPTAFDGESKDASENSRRLRSFLREVQRFLQVIGLEESCRGIAAAHFLKGSALLVWELELDDIVNEGGLSAVTWSKFESCMTEQYSSLMPEREARTKYDTLVHKDSVATFVRDFRQCMRELSGTNFHNAGSAMLDFLKKLKAPVRKYVQDSAPDGWYQNTTQLYKKALNWEYNKQAAVVVDQDQQQSTSQGTELAGRFDKRRRSAAGKRTERYTYDQPQKFWTNAPPAKKGKKGGGKGDNKAPGSGVSQGPSNTEFQARKEAGKCGACGMPGHTYKNEAGEKTCPNLRNPAPHATITKAIPKAKQG